MITIEREKYATYTYIRETSFFNVRSFFFLPSTICIYVRRRYIIPTAYNGSIGTTIDLLAWPRSKYGYRRNQIFNILGRLLLFYDIFLVLVYYYVCFLVSPGF